MTPEEFAQHLAQYGRTVVLYRRLASQHDLTVECAARVDHWRPDEMVDEVIQGRRTVIISNHEIEQASWPGPPVRGDLLLIDGLQTTIWGVETIEVGGVVMRHNLVVEGA